MAAPGVQFSYCEMYNFYRSFGEITNDVFVRVYTADGRPGVMRPFVQRSMQVRRVPDDDPVSYPERGTFLVYRSPDQIRDKNQRLFVVTPKETQNALYGTFWVGDHFSFLSNSGLEESKRLQLHETLYFLDPTDDTLGKVETTLSPLPLRFLLPEVGFEQMLSPKLTRSAPFLWEVMRRPFAGQLRLSIGGGPKRRRQRGGDTPAEFEDLWYALPIRSMTVVGVRVGRTYDVSVYVRDTANNVENRVLLVKCLERDVEGEIAKGFARFNRDNFRFDELPDDYYDI